VRYASVLADPAAERAADHGREASLSLLPVRDAGRTADCAFLARVCRNHALPLLFNALTIFGGTAAGCFRSERLGWLLGLLVLLLAVTSLVAALGYWEWQERILVRECRRRQLLRKRAEKRLPDALGMLS
jgi:Cys-tRNA synthase (O-phospho-L-seryl-tRNA:Cys-tRNA synthase)